MAKHTKDEPEVAAAASELPAGPSDYVVKEGHRLSHNGEVVKAGGIVSLLPEEAARVLTQGVIAKK